MMRRIILAVAVLAILLGGLVWTRPAYALGDLCKDVPAPAAPQRGLAGLFTREPAQPATGDPFANPQIPIMDVYGTSWHWTVYDLGCTPNALADPIAVIETTTANGVLDGSSAGVAVLDQLERLARAALPVEFTSWVEDALGKLRPLIFGGDSATGPIFGLLPLGLLVTAIVVVMVARRADLAKAARISLITVTCIVLAGWAILLPKVASETTDGITRQVSSLASTSFSTSLTDGVNRNALHRAWLAGAFGDADSPVAREFGPRLMSATHYTWAEWDRIKADPAAREGIDRAKETEFRAVADALKDQHPTVYLTFQGKGERTGPASFGAVAVVLMGAFAFVAYMITLIARLMMQILVIAAPVAAIAGLMPSGDRALRRMWDLFVASLWAVLKFTLAAGIMTVAMGMLSALDNASAMLWMTVLTIAGLVVLRPVRTFKTMIPGADPNRSYVKDLLGAVQKVSLGAFGGAAAGHVIANRAERAQDAPEVETAATVAPRRAAQVGRVELQARPPMPPPPPLGPGGPVAPGGPMLPGGPAPAGASAALPGPATAQPGMASALTAGSPAAATVPPAQITPATDPTIVVQMPERPTATTAAGSSPAASTTEHAPPTTSATAVLQPRASDITNAEIVADTYYRRASETVTKKPDVITSLQAGRSRDLGTDQPAGEIVLYQSTRKAV